MIRGILTTATAIALGIVGGLALWQLVKGLI